MDGSPSNLMKRYEFLRSVRKTLEGDWEFIERFIMPMRLGRMFQEYTSEEEVDARRPEVYDSTAMNAADLLAASIHGSLTTPDQKWFEFSFRQDDLNEDWAAKEWLEECGERVYQELQESNFNLEIAEVYLDLVGPGNGVMMVEARDELDWDGLAFTAVPLRESFFEPDDKQGIKAFYRRLQWTPVQICSKFELGDIPSRVVSLANSGEGINQKLDLIMCIFPRQGWKTEESSGAVAPGNRPYGRRYVLADSREPVGKEGGYYEMPANVARWRTRSGSWWGYGPGNLALPTVMSLNEKEKMSMVALEKVIDPAIMVAERGLIGQLDLGPAGINVVREMGAMQPFESGARIDWDMAKTAEYRQMVEKFFKVDELQLKDSPAMTATEAQYRWEIMQRLLGPTLGRIVNDVLNPVLETTFKIMFRAGQLPPPPQALSNADPDIDIDYLGPLARAQRANTVASIERYLGRAAELGEAYPELKQLVDAEAAGRELADLDGVPTKILKPAARVKREVRDQNYAKGEMADAEIRRAQAEAAQAENMAVGGPAANNLPV